MKRFLPILLIVAAPMAMMYPLWANPVSAGEDDVLYYYPVRKMVGQALAEGRLPVMNELAATGTPLMADPQASIMCPLTWLFAVLEAKLAYSLSIFAAFAVAGLGMYGYLRRLALARPAAFLGAIAFMFSGFLVGHRVHLTMILTAAMLPWMLLGVELAAERKDGIVAAAIVARSRPWVALAVLSIAVYLALAAGSWPTMIHMTIILGVYVLFRGRPLGRCLLVVAGGYLFAVAWAGPQILAAADLLGQATRQKIGLATAGENSFAAFPVVLAFFPMLMGNRTPNFFDQPWWGPWHQCEMLGYVGLATLVLAGAAILRAYRRKQAAELAAEPGAAPEPAAQYCGVVRTWVWIGILAFLWMLGYYLPTYRYIHMIPVIGVVRCPARMVLAVDFALAALAAVGMHLAIQSRAAGAVARTIRRGATIWLPVGLLASIGIIAGLALIVERDDYWHVAQFVGGPREALAAIHLSNPAVWVQLFLAAATVAALWAFLRRPGVLWVLPVCVLIVDLFFVARFVDVPEPGAAAPDPEVSPAAAWIKEHAPADKPSRVLGLSRDYYVRAPELLLPCTANGLGISTIASYGPFQSPAHAQLLSFNGAAYSREWESLLRRNYLLSLYNVRYIVAADERFCRVIESVKMPSTAPASGPATAPAEGPAAPAGEWQLENSSTSGDVLVLRTDSILTVSRARRELTLEPGRVYRISLDARGPDHGPAGYLRAQIDFLPVEDGRKWEETWLSVKSEEMGGDWRHFEFVFQTPVAMPAEKPVLNVFTQSERPIEVRNVTVLESHLDVPIDPWHRMGPGESVYAMRVHLPAVHPGDTPVTIYENLLCRDADPREFITATPGEIEHLKWAPSAESLRASAPAPEIGLRADLQPWRALELISAPAMAVWLLLLLAAAWITRRKVLREQAQAIQIASRLTNS